VSRSEIAQDSHDSPGSEFGQSAFMG
jgi:hypothetical protein